MDFIWNKIQFVITDLGGGKLGEKIPMHVHAKGCYELHFITEGKGTLIADGREIELINHFFTDNLSAHPIENLHVIPDIHRLNIPLQHIYVRFKIHSNRYEKSSIL